MKTAAKAAAIAVSGLMFIGVIAPDSSSEKVTTTSSPTVQENTIRSLTTESEPVRLVPVVEEDELKEKLDLSDYSLDTPDPEPTPVKRCHSGYSGCLNPSASDYDCVGGSGNGPYYTGTVQVFGSDPFGLDRDNDGWGV